MSHYIAIGIKNFVLIDNDSDDGSLSCIESIIEPVNIDIFVTKDKFDSFKSCGWRQRMIAYYGANRWYLDLDVDELMVFPGVEEGGIGKIIAYAESHKLQAIGSFMLDIYPNRPILKIDKDNNDLRSDYKYIDVDTYNLVSNPNYNYRIFGGPRYRMLKVRPSLQKFPLIFVNGQTININPHFWYPFKLNFNSSLVSALLHYKFLPGDLEQYKVYAKTGVHWDNSSEYKVYVKALRANPKLNFFDAGHSVEYEDSGTLSELKRSDGQPLLSDINN